MPDRLDLVDDRERVITDPDYALFQRLVLRESGIRLNASKRALLIARLGPRVRDLGLSSFRKYYQLLQTDENERRAMVDRITTNETSFFREPRQFDILQQQIVPAWQAAAGAGKRARRLRVWSAGCSTGEEPYSIAMLLDSLCAGWEIEILATDISTRVLEAAANGTFTCARAAAIPSHYLRRYMLEGVGSQAGKVRVVDDIRRLITFSRLNLHDAFNVGGPFDLILCRNVLIYFDSAARGAIVERLVDHCDRGGYLFLGHAETLSDCRSRVRVVESTVWVRR